MANYRISFQLYSARKFPPLEAQLEALAAIGFDAVEPYGALYEADPGGFRKKLDAVGLPCPSAHVALATLDADRRRAIAIAQTLGLETVIIPHIAAEKRPADTAGWKALASRVSGHAAALAEAGFKLAWHNHDFEYHQLPDGSRPIDHLMGAPGVMFEPDIGWIVRAGCQPKTEIAKFPGKVAAVHVKDVAAEGVTADDGWTDVGAGTVDWKGIWPVIAASGVELLVLEHDNPSDWRSFAARSHDYLAGLVGAGRH
jgi:sugar phosphate isomerase/epimerase